MKRIFSLFCAVLLFAGCTPQRAATDGRLTVYTSFYAMEDFAKTVGGDLITLTNLVPAGTEAHDWEPGPRDLAGLEQADVFLYNSDDMEHWVDSLEDQLEKKEILVVETADGLEDDADDPHVWLNPANALIQMQRICDAFCEKDSANADTYRQNLEEAAEKIRTLDEKYRSALAGVSHRELVVTHGAYGYLANAYGLSQLAIEGMQGTSDPSPAQMAKMIEEIKEKGIGCIFYEADGESKIAESIAKECSIMTAPLNPFEGDAKGRDYFSVMEENLEYLEQGLK